MRTLVTLLALIVTGCTPAQPPVIPRYDVKAAWDEEHARSLLEPGSNNIKGDAFLRQQGGGVVTCAGLEVILLPATEYARERIRELYNSNDRGLNSSVQYDFHPNPYEYSELRRTTLCNSQGNFEFAEVADGQYFVITTVQWQVANTQMGGSLMHYVAVGGGVTKSLVMTN